MTEITQEEKIDYIYNHIKAEKRYYIYKILFKVWIFIAIFVSIYNMYNNLWADKIKSTISTQIWELTSPIIKDLVQDLEDNTVNWINSDVLMETLKNNPELLDKIKSYDY